MQGERIKAHSVGGQGWIEFWKIVNFSSHYVVSTGVSRRVYLRTRD